MIKRLFDAVFVLFCFAALFTAPSKATGAILSENFELPFRTNHANSFVLEDYAGQIVVLEFFYSWCPHCQAATPKVHTDIIDYYNTRGGNIDGLPVKVVYVNLEWRAGSYQTDTDAFIAAHDMEVVLDDFFQEAFTLYGSSPGGTPRFVIINGVANSSSHQQWEVVHQGDGFSATTTINTLKSKIDSIRGTSTPVEISVSPNTIDFGTVAIGNNVVGLLAVTNHSDVEVNNATATVGSGPFSILQGASFNLGGNGNANVVLRFAPSAAGSFERTVSIVARGNTVTNVTLRGRGVTAAQLSAKPVVTVTAPADRARLLNPTVTVSGKVTSKNIISEVLVGVNNRDPVVASGTTNWSRVVELDPGTNVIQVRATDEFNNLSPIITRRVVYVVTSPLNLTVTGTGTVTPDLNGQLLEVGRNYTFTVRPGVGHLFANWSGDVVSEAAKLTIPMSPNLALQANFIVNPFVAAKGTYNGLFYADEDITVDTAGFVTFTVADTGKYTGRFQMGGARLSFSGQFDLQGQSTLLVPRPGKTPLEVSLSIDLTGGDQITGHIQSDTWSAGLQADRAVFSMTNPANGLAGKYTIVLPSDESENSQPAGAGFGTVTVTTAGQLTFTGTLADGTKVTQRVPVSKDGRWPLYLPLYRNLGFIIAWIEFRDGEQNDLQGEALWIRPTQLSSKIYPQGLTNVLLTAGSRYVVPAAGVRVIDVDQGITLLNDGDLLQNIRHEVALGTDNKVVNLSEGKLTLTITLATGLFTGTVQVPGSTTLLKFNGALLQNQDFGLGFFIGATHSGTVYFGPDP